METEDSAFCLLASAVIVLARPVASVSSQCFIADTFEKRYFKFIRMKTFALVTGVFLVSLCREVQPSNQDSERVQDTSSPNDSNKHKRSATIRMADDSQKTFTYLQRIPIQTDFREMRPQFLSRLRLVPLPWITSSMITVLRRDSLFDRRVSNRRPDMVVSTGERSSNDKNNSSNRSIIPGVSYISGPLRKPTDSNPVSNNASSGEVGISGNFQPPSSPNDGQRYYTEQGNTRNQNIRPPSSVGPILLDNGSFNLDNPVFGINETFGNFKPNEVQGDQWRPSPQLPMNPSNTPADSPLRRNVLNGNANTTPKSPEFVRGVAPEPDRRISPDFNLFATIINDFSFKLVEEMNLEKNFVLSPLSLFIALSMCYLGSDGSTKTELERVLGLNKYSVHGLKFHQGMEDLISLILTQSPNYELYLANAMFLGKNFTVNPKFEEDVLRYYLAELRNLDFRNPQLSVPVINQWVSKNTRNMISSFSDSIPSPFTRLLVLNAIFFKGIWKKQFPPDMTYAGRFFSSDGSENIVPTMPLYKETFPFFRSEEHGQSFIKLPYEGDQVSMIIALPFTIEEKPMSAMTNQILCDVRDAFVDTKMDTVAIPRFRIDYTQPLKKALMKFGLVNLFYANTVNLSKMRAQNDVTVSAILQKAVIDINERGTTATAITAVELKPISFRYTTDFVVNRPFAFYILHEPSGLVLFHGKIHNIGERRDTAPNNRRDLIPQKNTAPELMK